MNTQDPQQVTPETPQAKVKKHVRFSPIWLIPILVIVVVVYVVYDIGVRKGTVITLTFKTADGLVPGETPVKHKNVRLGTVEDVRLSDDLSHVIVKVRIERQQSSILTDHARFWVVRPRFQGLAGLQSGLETLVSGAYIAIDPGVSGGAKRETFEGLEEPPGVRSDDPGKVVMLRAKELGALGPGSPIYFRDIAVGEILKYEFGEMRDPISIRAFIHAPYDRFVVTETRFYNVSGLNVNVGAAGLHVELTSLQAVISGAIAFDTPLHASGPPTPDNTMFHLFDNKESADDAQFKEAIHCVAYFDTSIQGLVAGSAVDLLGTPVGLVRDVRTVNDPKKPGGWLARVAFDIQPGRMAVGSPGAAHEGGPRHGPAPPTLEPITADALRAHPPKVVLDTASFITGQKLLDLDYSGGSSNKPNSVGEEGDALVLQGQSGGFDNVTVALGRIAGKIEQIPFEDIGKNLDATLVAVKNTVGGEDLKKSIAELATTMQDVRKLMAEADHNLTPVLQRLPAMAEQLSHAIENANQAFGNTGYGADSDFQRNTQRLMREVGEAARSIRLLADFLDKHPEALLRGRTNQSSEK